MRELPPPYVTNERFKSVSRMLFQLGTGLFAAGAVKGYTAGGLAAETMGWLFISAVLIWLGWLILGLLEPEK